MATEMVYRLKRISCLALAFFLVLAGCNFAGNPGKAADEQVRTATASIDAAGGTITLHDLQVSIAGNNLPSTTTVTLEETITPVSEVSEITAQSNTYHLRDLPPDFSGTLDITFAIPDELLRSLDSNDPDRAKKIVLMLGEDGYSRSGGGVVNLFAPMLDAQVDLEAKQVTARIDFSELAALPGWQKMAAPARSAPSAKEWWETTPKNLYFKVVAGFFWNSTRNGLFTVYFPHNTYAGPVVDALIQAQSKLESLGLNVGPLSVYLEDPNGNDGLFSWSLRRGYYMAIHPRLLASGKEKPLQVTVGHELMHYAQLLTYQDQGDLDSYNSLDEATAIWFESYLLSDPNYLPELADQHILTFLYSPWFAGSNQETRRAGYGASWYVHYLAKTCGTDFVAQAYNGRHIGGKASWALGVLDACGANNDLAFRQFLTAFVIRPGNVSPALESQSPQRYNDIFERNVRLEKQPTGPVVFTAWENGIPKDAGTEFGSSEGAIIGSPLEYTFDPEPVFSINRTLSPWNGYYVFLKVVPSLFPYDEGQLDVYVYSSGQYSGVMLYAVPRGGRESDAIALHGPKDYLASDAKDFTIVDSLSSKDGDGAYSGIIFILFNSGDEDSDISLNVIFGPSKPATLSGEAVAANWAYPENTCDLSCCTPYTNPPACVSQSGGGEGGNGDSNAACNKPCPQVPEWCYWCSENSGASALLQLARGYNPNVELLVDADGEINVNSFSIYGDLGEPVSHSSSNGSFRTEWAIDDFNGKPKIRLAMSGNANTSGGSGSWSVSYDGIGQMVSGTWSAAP